MRSTRPYIYRARSLVDGYKLGVEFRGRKYVAIPKHTIEKHGKVAAVVDNKIMEVDHNTKPVYTQTFPDQFGRGEYTLCYFQWIEKKKRPVVQDDRISGVISARLEGVEKLISAWRTIERRKKEEPGGSVTG